MIRIIFLFLSLLGLSLAVGTVLARNLVRAALYLVGFFFIVACQFVLLEAEFMAAMQVLVYIGAVAILLLFGIMLTRNIQGDETTTDSNRAKGLLGLLSLGLFVALVVGISAQKIKPRSAHVGSIEEEYAKAIGKPMEDRARKPWSELVGRLPVGIPHPEATDETVAKPLPPRTSADERGDSINNMGKMVGDEMMTRFVVPFEIAGLLLTIALVGAVVLARHAGAEEPPPRPGQKVRPGVLSTNGAPAGTPDQALTTIGEAR